MRALSVAGLYEKRTVNLRKSKSTQKTKWRRMVLTGGPYRSLFRTNRSPNLCHGLMDSNKKKMASNEVCHHGVQTLHIPASRSKTHSRNSVDLSSPSIAGLDVDLAREGIYV